MRVEVQLEDDELLVTVADNGVGFGMEQMRELAEGMGGSLLVESMPRSGTHVHARILRVVAQSGRQEVTGVDEHSIRVVVAHDHDLFRKGLRQLLETIPSVEIVGVASDGQEAIRLVADAQPDVILMDINMPRVDGVRATEYIVKHYPETNVIVLTMHQDADEEPASSQRS